jgi:ureidoacrylate peracid hydrolase
MDEPTVDVIRLTARPEPVDLDPRRSAVVVVDMQNDFGAVGGMFERAGIDITGIRSMVPRMSVLIDEARRSGMTIVFLKMAFRPDLSDAGAPSSPTWIKHLPMRAGERVVAPTGAGSRILIRDTWNTDLIDELVARPDDVVLYKHRFSGFYETELDAILRTSGIDTLLFVGATTSVCVESTVRDAMFRDYHCIVVEDCVAEPIGAGLARGNHDASLLVLEILFGSVADSTAVLSALQRVERAVPESPHRAVKEQSDVH